MRSSLPVRRGLDVVTPITVYRAIGRRPSTVCVDDQRQITRGPGSRLWDLVYQVHLAQPGDQLQDRQGTIVLLSKSGDCHRVQLSPPTPRSVSTAFTHAQSSFAADCAVVDRLLADGSLAVASIRRIKQPPPNPANVKFGEDHPLVITDGPSP